MVAEPHIQGREHASDLLSLGRLYEELGELDAAVNLYHQGLEHEDVLSNNVSRDLLGSATFRLAMIYKRKGKFEKAIELWEQTTKLNHIGAFIELAKYYEHNAREYNTAIYWTNTALDLIKSATGHIDLPIGVSIINKNLKSEEFIHRLNRLNKKLQK
jgi:tetratricopeptide (TPR) repeat protein